jgi:hypothetical protein
MVGSQEEAMLAKNMLEFKEYLNENGIVFSYSGYMTEEVLMGIGNAIKKKLELDQVARQKSKVVFSVFVEQVQNVIRYSAEREGEQDKDELRYGLLTVGEFNNQVFVSCGNLVAKRDHKELERNLTKIKNLDKAGLKALWKETLRGETPEGSKGAGVGFIDIARRAKGGIDFDFSEVDDENVFFTLKAYI